MKYSYYFSCWPDESVVDSSSVLFELFRIYAIRVSTDMTEEEFSSFRERLLVRQITLREIERIPYQDPETIL
jgi:hypothetical protein